MQKTVPVLVLVGLAVLVGAGRAIAVGSYQTAFNNLYPTSTTGTTSWSSSSARCNVCHSEGGGTDLNAYGAAWALRHNTGVTAAQAFQDIQGQNSDGSAVNDIGEITANAQPGWRPGPNNTLFDQFEPNVMTRTGQSPPASLIGGADPAAANGPPMLTMIANQTVGLGQLLQFTATATDPDGNALTFSIANPPTGATLTPDAPGTAIFRWTPTLSQGGATYSPTITVTDTGSPALMAQQTFTITVGGLNRPPVLNPIADQTVSENQLLQFDASATDPDGNSLTFSIANQPTGATLTDNGNGIARFAWTPSFAQSGNYTNVLITVTDNGSPALTAQRTFTITVGDINRPPVLTPVGGRTTNVNQLLQFTISATDPDGHALSFTTTSNPAVGSTLADNRNGTATFAWTPSTGQAANYPVTVVVTDDGSPAQSTSETFTITVGAVNRPPVLSPVGNRTVNEGQALSINITASDPDGGALSFAASSNPAATGATFTDNRNGTGTFEWTPSFSQAGNYSVTVVVTDGGSPALSVSETFTVTVGNVNRPPVLGPIGNRTVNEGQPLTINITASDPDGGALSFAMTSDPASTGSTFTDNRNGTATLAWTPSPGQTGSYSVTVTASDAGTPALNVSETFTISVQATPTNRPPSVTNPGNKTVIAGQLLAFTITGSDPDGNSLTFSAGATLPTGATLSPSGAFSWTPPAAQVSATTYSVTVTDTDNGAPPLTSAPQTFTIRVQPPESPMGSVRIEEAKWERATLKVKGKVGTRRMEEADRGPSTLKMEGRASARRVMVTVVNVDTGATIGTIMAGSDGKWELKVPLASALCRVQAKAGVLLSKPVRVHGAGGCRARGGDEQPDRIGAE